MKTRYYIVAFAALLASACSRNANLMEEDVQQLTFKAYQEGYDAQTKTTVQNGGTQVYWEPAEEIKVFFNGASGHFLSQNTENTTVATFTGTLNVVVGATEGANYSTETWGLYPYRSDAVLADGCMVTTLPASQTGRAGSFAKNTNISVAQSDGYGLAFYNVCGGVRFSLTQEGIKRVTFEGNNDEAIAGKIKIAFADGVPVVQEVTEPETLITLTAPGDSTFQTGQWYYISAMPGTLSGGFKMQFYKEDESAVLTSSSAVIIKRGIFGSIADADNNLSFQPMGLTFTGSAENLTETSAELIVIPSNQTEYWYMNWVSEIDMKKNTLTDVMQNSINNAKSLLGQYTAAQILCHGQENIQATELFPGTEYNVVAWGMNLNMEATTEPKVVFTFKTNEYPIVDNCTFQIDVIGLYSQNGEFRVTPSNLSTRYFVGIIESYRMEGYSDKQAAQFFINYENHYMSIYHPAWDWANHPDLQSGVQVINSHYLQSDGDYSIYVFGINDLGIRTTDVARLDISNGSVKPKPEDIIQFADQIAKYACVEKYDTNHDGEVSYEEAAAATSFSGLFTDWNTVTEFDEICYFTSVTSTQNVFNGLSHLKHITIPDNITTLGTFQNCAALDTVTLPAALNSIPTYCFDGCSSLKSVTLPTGITSIPNYAFRGCAALENLDVPSTLTSVGQYAFSGCTVFAGIDMPSGFTTIGNYAFQNCQAIVSVGFPASLTSIGQYAYSGCTALASATIESCVSLGHDAFSGCFSLVSVALPEDMTVIPSYCFRNCIKLTTITWPNALTTIGDSAFAGCRFEDNDYTLQLPSSVTSIGSNAFGLLRHLVLPSTSPISIASDSFASGYTVLYVPSGMVEMYKVRTNWSNYADRIRPMSDYPVTSFTIGTVGEAVDLGLSVKWASWNVGASSPEGYGAYFAWGETDMKWDYDWSTYKWCNGDYNKLTKYCPTNIADYWDGTGSPDGKTVLDLEDDAARANWGGTWRMPTDAEWTELRNNCTWTWTTQNGVNGRLVTSNSNGNSIFLPAAGGRGDSGLGDAGSYGRYWSSSLHTDYPEFARYVCFYSGDVYRSDYFRYFGQSVRPVSE